MNQDALSVTAIPRTLWPATFHTVVSLALHLISVRTRPNDGPAGRLTRSAQPHQSTARKRGALRVPYWRSGVWPFVLRLISVRTVPIDAYPRPFTGLG